MATPREIIDERLAKGEITIDEHTALAATIATSSNSSSQSLPAAEWGKVIITIILFILAIRAYNTNPSAESFHRYVETAFAQLAASGEAAKNSSKGLGEAVFGLLCTASPVECGRLMKSRFTISTHNLLLFSIGELRKNEAPYELTQCYGLFNEWHCPN